MKRGSKICLALVAVVGVVSIFLYIPLWNEDALARRNKGRVNELVHVGQMLNEAEAALKAAGFRLSYEKPIKPIGDQGYLQQLVIVGETRINGFESFGYAAGCPMPFTHGESPYVVLNAALDGTITEIR